MTNKRLGVGQLKQIVMPTDVAETNAFTISVDLDRLIKMFQLKNR